MEIAAIKAVMSNTYTAVQYQSIIAMFQPRACKEATGEFSLSLASMCTDKRISLQTCQKGLQMSSTPSNSRKYWSDVPSFLFALHIWESHRCSLASI